MNILLLIFVFIILCLSLIKKNDKYKFYKYGEYSRLSDCCKSEIIYNNGMIRNCQSKEYKCSKCGLDASLKKNNFKPPKAIK